MTRLLFTQRRIMSKVNCEAVGKRRQAPPGMARAELLHFRLKKKEKL